MFKKIFFAAFLLVLAAAVWAADFGIRVGGGLLHGLNFSSSETDPAILVADPTAKMDLAYKTKTFDVGAFLFADATYAEVSVAYFAELGNVTGITSTITGATIPGMNGKFSMPDEDYASHIFTVYILGKYPFVLDEKFTVFPILGVGFKFPIAGNENSDKEHDVTWGVVGKAGAGLDFSLTQALFLRCEALFAYQFASDKEATIDGTEYQFKSVGYNLGPQVKIGVGYKVL